MKIPGTDGEIEIERDDAGVAHVTAESRDDAMMGLGFCHARDRGLQMLMARILGRGQASEVLQASDEMFELDRFFRGLNFAGDATTQFAALSPEGRAGVDAYCRGVNLWFSKLGSVPWELRLLGYRMADDTWTAADVFLTASLVGYVSLAHSQAEMERFIVECVQAGVAREKLEELFPGQLDALDELLVRRVTLQQRLVPASLKWASALPRMTASNNWVLSGTKTASGRPFLCNDPHLEVNRLPAVWYEVVLQWRAAGGTRYALGSSVPGTPGVLVGRSAELAWGVTYAFMDSVDSWIEECRDGKFRRGERWTDWRPRKEIIRRKRKPPVEIVFHENDHGLLEGDPHTPGLYLATRWACGEDTGTETIDAALRVLDARTIEEGRRCLGRICNSSWNWVLADRDGNIGYQMSGRMPLRRDGASGLVPLPGWDAANDWRGFATPEELPRALNPSAGFIVTANNDLNHLGRRRPLNLPMSPHRAERIEHLLRGERPFTVADMKTIQLDAHSLQAARFMDVIAPLLGRFAQSHTAPVEALRTWDLDYDADSRGAFVFERVYQALIETVFGDTENGFGPAVQTYLLNESSLVADFHWNFDRVLLAEKSTWFGQRTREEIFVSALEMALAEPVQVYGANRQVVMRHLLFGGKLPAWLGFDRGPITLPGSRATVQQGQIYRSGGRDTTFAPSLRLVMDLATDEAHTALAGGVSDRRWSRWYVSDFENWLHGRYKKVSVTS